MWEQESLTVALGRAVAPRFQLGSLSPFSHAPGCIGTREAGNPQGMHDLRSSRQGSQERD